MSEITDSTQFSCLLERPHDREQEPDIHAIGESLRANLWPAPRRSQGTGRKARAPEIRPKTEHQARASARESRRQTAVERFLQGKEMNHEKWHYWLKYDLPVLKRANPQELTQIEDFLVSHPVSAWRHVQALAALDSPPSWAVLHKTLKGRDRGLAAAVRVHAPNLLSEPEQAKTLVAALTGSESNFGLRHALLQVEEFHPPQVVDALFRGALIRYGVAAVYLAAMLMFVRGKADSPFDSRQLPFLLKFNTEVRAKREAVFLELCEKLEVDGTQYLAAANAESRSAS